MPGEFYQKGKAEKVDIKGILAGLSELENKLESLVVYWGETTALGAADGSTLICSDLTAKPNYDGNIVVIKSGTCVGQGRVINGATTGGTVTPDTAFDGQIVASVKFAILAIRTGSAQVTAIEAKLDNGTSGLAALKALIDAVEGKLDSGTSGLAALKALIDTVEAKGDAIQTRTDKLAGEAPGTGSATADWQAAEADVVSIGADDAKYKLHSLLLSIQNLVGTAVTVRLYMQVDGTEHNVYEQVLNATTDPPGLWIVNGTVGIHEVLRVTLQSNDAADNGKAVGYDYMLEAM